MSSATLLSGFRRRATSRRATTNDGSRRPRLSSSSVGIATRDELLAKEDAAIDPRQIANAVATHGPAPVKDEPGSKLPRARFAKGDRVRARNINPSGHTRLPRYVRGKAGVIARDWGVLVFPDPTRIMREPSRNIVIRSYSARASSGANPRAASNCTSICGKIIWNRLRRNPRLKLRNAKQRNTRVDGLKNERRSSQY